MSEATEALLPKFSRRVIELAVAKVFGTTMSDACRLTQVSERAAYKWLAAHRAEVEEVMAFITPILKETKREIQEVAAANFKSELEKRIGAAVAAVDKGLGSDDRYLDAFDRVAAYTVGKPANKHVVEGGVSNTLTVRFEPSAIAAMQQVVTGSSPLWNRAKALEAPKVIDVSPT